MLSSCAIPVVLVITLLLLGCTPESQPVDLTPVWSHGEVTRYDLLAKDGTVVGAKTWEVRQEEPGWTLVNLDEHGDVKGEMVMDGSLRPVRGWSQKGGLRAETVYLPDGVVIKRTDAKGKLSEATFPNVEGTIDNEQGLQTFRSLPLGPEFRTTYTNLSAAGGTIPFTIGVAAEERLIVPAGQFDTYRVNLDFGASRHEAWYGRELPHLLVKYDNPNAGVTFVLRSWRQGEGKPDHGQVTPPPVPEPGNEPISPGLVAIVGFLQLPLMSLLPVVLGIFLVRKLKVSGKLLFAGAVAFIASQVVHLPLNWAIGLLGPPRGAGLLPLPYMAIIAGATAGVCEEVARYVALGVVLRKIRHSWNEAVVFGVGHGGVEAMILGALVAINLGAMIILQVWPGLLGLEGETLAQVMKASDSFWRTPWHAPVAGGIERVFAISAHIGMTVLVMRAIATRKLVYLFGAIVAHTVLNAVAVIAVARLSLFWTEALIALGAACLLGIAFGLRGASWPKGPQQEADAAKLGT